MVNNTARLFAVTGTSGFAGQGGSGNGCGIPLSATAIATNVTVTAVTAAGYLTGYPTGATAPTTNFISYTKGATLTANPILAIAADGRSQPLTVTAHGGNTQMIVDVTGYYIPQIEGVISPGGGIYAGTTRMQSAVRNSVGDYTVTVDTDVTYCAPTVTVYGGGFRYATAYGFTSDTVQVYVWALDSTTNQPVLSDQYFYLKVDC